MTSSRVHRLTVLLAAATSSAVVLVGCGGGSQGPTGTGSPLPAPSAASSAASRSTSPPPASSPSTGPTTSFSAGGSPTVPGTFAGTLGPVVRSGMPTPASLLTAIRTSHHPGYDRVVLELAGALPGYRVAYVRQVLEDPSGRPVALAGDARLQVTLHGATTDTAFQTSQGGTPHRYTGPRQLVPDLPSVKEIQVVGDFEAVLSIGMGVDHQVPFRASTLAALTRVVVDVAAP